MAKLERQEMTDRYHCKTWGSETWIENNDKYCGKILYFCNTGRGTTLHLHALKEETMFVESGMLRLDLVDPETGEPYEMILGEGEAVFIPRFQAHRLTPIEDGTRVFEFSTHHEDTDSYRVGPRSR